MNIIKNSLPDDGFHIVEVSNVRKIYLLGSLGIPTLSEVNLKTEIEELLDMAPSGSEKSTLMNLIDCRNRITEGQVLLSGRDLNKMPDQELALLQEIGIGFVFQTLNFVPRLTAFENVLLPTFANSRSNIAPTKHSRGLLEVMEFRNRMHHKPGELSGGQSQRVSIAPHINDPAILLANEPTGKP